MCGGDEPDRDRARDVDRARDRARDRDRDRDRDRVRRVLRSGDFSGDGVWRFALIDEDGAEEVLHFSANGDIVS